MGSRYGLQIRAATAADAPGIAELMASAGRIVPAPTLAARLEAFRLTPGVALLAEAWGPPSGLAVLSWVPTLAADEPAAQLSTLLVAPDERRTGIGRLLLKAGAQAARAAGCGALHVTVAPDATGLAEFCEATGFSENGTGHVRPLRKRG